MGSVYRAEAVFAGPILTCQFRFRGKLPHKKKPGTPKVSESSQNSLYKTWGAVSYEQGRWRPKTLESGFLL